MIELGPGTGPVTEALVERGVDPSRLVLVEFNPVFCRLLRTRYPDATVVQGDAYRLRSCSADCCASRPPRSSPACRCSPSRSSTRMRLIDEAFALMAPDAPFVQFTYAMVPPIPKRLDGRHAPKPPSGSG